MSECRAGSMAAASLKGSSEDIQRRETDEDEVIEA